MHRKVIFSFFFSAIFLGPRFVEIQTFCHQGNVTRRLLPSIESAINTAVDRVGIRQMDEVWGGGLSPPATTTFPDRLL